MPADHALNCTEFRPRPPMRRHPVWKTLCRLTNVPEREVRDESRHATPSAWSPVLLPALCGYSSAALCGYSSVSSHCAIAIFMWALRKHTAGPLHVLEDERSALLHQKHPAGPVHVFEDERSRFAPVRRHLQEDCRCLEWPDCDSYLNSQENFVAVRRRLYCPRKSCTVLRRRSLTRRKCVVQDIALALEKFKNVPT